ncbi:MAG: type II secretion system protein GspM [Bryobacteraceae bacterium]
MTINKRDRRALLLLGIAVIITLIWRSRLEDSPAEESKAAVSVPSAEKQLLRLRQIEATIPAKDALLKDVTRQADGLEQGLLQAETAAQAQAQLLQTIRRVGKTEGIDTRGGEIGAVRVLGEEYGEVSVAVTFDCQIEQLLNLLAALNAEPKLLATEDLRISSANNKEKKLNVRLAVSGVVDKKLVPEKRGPAL